MRTHRPTLKRAGAGLAVAVLAGLLSPLSAEAAVAVPGGLVTNAAGTTQLKDLELQWNATSGAVGYDVQISDESDFAGTVLTGSPSTAHWAVPTQLPRGEYVWRVRTRTAEGPGAWSSLGSIVRGWDPAVRPGNPHLVTQAGVQTGGTSVTLANSELPSFTWDAIAGASFYELEISRAPFHSYPPASGTDEDKRFTCYTQHTWFAPYGVGAGPSDAPGDEANCVVGVNGTEEPPADGTMGSAFYAGETYYWRVRGRDGTSDDRQTPFPDPALSCTGVWYGSGGTVGDDGNVTIPIPSTPPAYLAKPECSQWSDGGSFTLSDLATVADSVGKPTGLSVGPTVGLSGSSVIVSGTPIFQWEPVAGAGKYRVYVSRTTDFLDSDAVYETLATSLTPVHSYADRSVPMYWTVQACGVKCGDIADGQHSFIKKSWNGVSAKTVSTAGGETTLSWSPQWGAPAALPASSADQAASYQLQVDTITGDFSNPNVDVKVDHLGGDQSSVYWRTATSRLPDEFVWRVRAIDETGRAWPWSESAPWARITTASGFGLRSTLTIDFTAPVQGASASTVKVVDPAGASVEGRLSKVTPTRYKFSPTGSWVAGQQYRLWVTSGVKDTRGRAVQVVPDSTEATKMVDSASPALVKVRGDTGWTTSTASDARGRSFVWSTDKASTTVQSKVIVKVAGKRIYLDGCKSPNSGRARVLIDGSRVATLDLYRSYSGCGQLWTSPAMADRAHTVKVVLLGQRSSRSRGTVVSLDAVRVS